MKVKQKVQEACHMLGFEKPRKFQIDPINTLLDERDTLVIALTSAGKSSIYQIPAIINAKKGKWTLVIEPLTSLMEDQVHKLNDHGINSGLLTSYNQKDHDAIQDKIRDGQVCILYVTAERLQSKAFRRFIKENPPWLVVIDEAHCTLDWGYSFRSDYLHISDFIDSLPIRPVVAAFTATAPVEYRKPLCNLLGMKKPEIYTGSLARNNLVLLKKDCNDCTLEKRLSLLKSSIKKYANNERVIVYCGTCKYVDLVSNYLMKKYPSEVVKCHAYMNSALRHKNEMRFINGRKHIMVATTAFGMGIDVPDIRLVVHFNLPLSVIDYYQQIGRAGRDGEKCHAVLLYHRDDIGLNRYMITHQNLSDQVQEWLMKRLEEMVSIAESNDCLMQQILTLLAEEKPSTCRHCTNCQKKRRGN